MGRKIAIIAYPAVSGTGQLRRVAVELHEMKKRSPASSAAGGPLGALPAVSRSTCPSLATSTGAPARAGRAHGISRRRSARPRHTTGGRNLPSCRLRRQRQADGQSMGRALVELVANVMGNGLSACTSLIGGEMLQSEPIRHFSTRLGSEAIRVGQAHGLSTGGDPASAAGDDRACRRGRRGRNMPNMIVG